MIQVGTVPKVCDKTGIILARCVKVLGPASKRIAVIGNVIIVSVKHVNTDRLRRLKLIKRKRFYRGTLHRALVVRTKVSFARSIGIYIKFDENSIVLVNKRVVPISNRVFGPILRELCIKSPSPGCMTRFMLQYGIRS